MNSRATSDLGLKIDELETAFVAAVDAGGDSQGLLDFLAYIAMCKNGYRPPAPIEGLDYHAKAGGAA